MHHTLLIAFTSIHFASLNRAYNMAQLKKYSDKCEILECTTCEFING